MCRAGGCGGGVAEDFVGAAVDSHDSAAAAALEMNAHVAIRLGTRAGACGRAVASVAVKLQRFEHNGFIEAHVEAIGFEEGAG